MPVRAIVDEHLIQFENFTGDTVDITFVSPDGAVTQKEKVPFDSNQIPSFGSQSSVHLASMVRLPNNKDIDWFPFIQNATTAFFCAAAVAATIVPSGGTSAVILGAGCAVLAYNTYLAIANKEPPVSVEKADIVISGAGCVHGVAKKDPLAVKDCSDAVIDIVEVVKKETQETEQKLVTMVGANPNTRSELVLEATVEPVPVSTSASECAGLNLTPEECANYGFHEYSCASCKCEVLVGGGTCTCRNDPTTGNYLFEGTGSLEGWTNIGLNTYHRISTDDGINYATTSEVTIIFNQSGYELIIIQTLDPKSQYLEKIVSKWIYQYVITK